MVYYWIDVENGIPKIEQSKCAIWYMGFIVVYRFYFVSLLRPKQKNYTETRAVVFLCGCLTILFNRISTFFHHICYASDVGFTQLKRRTYPTVTRNMRLIFEINYLLPNNSWNPLRNAASMTINRSFGQRHVSVRSYFFSELVLLLKNALVSKYQAAVICFGPFNRSIICTPFCGFVEEFQFGIRLKNMLIDPIGIWNLNWLLFLPFNVSGVLEIVSLVKWSLIWLWNRYLLNWVESRWIYYHIPKNSFRSFMNLFLPNLSTIQKCTLINLRGKMLGIDKIVQMRNNNLWFWHTLE